MSRKHTVILMLLVTVPLLALFGLSWRLVEAEQARTSQQFEDLLQANLVEIDRDITDYFDSIELDLLDLMVDPSTPVEIRELVRTQPLVDQIVVLNQEGRVIYPNIETLSSQESRFLLKVEQLIADRVFFQPSPDTSNTAKPDQQVVTISVDSEPLQSVFGFDSPDFVEPLRNNGASTNANASENAFQQTMDVTQEYGWYTWYWGKGLQLIHWRRSQDGNTVLAGLRRARWMADIVAELPNSEVDSDTHPALVRLIDSDGEIVYQWGSQIGSESFTDPVVSRHLSLPLHPWQLQHFGPALPFEIGTIATRVNLLAIGGVLSLGLLGLAIYLGREIGRQTREARERVNFVNQVSHELKTPLTNIRMYAELVQKDLDRIDPDDQRSQEHVSVITSESSRLSRLINNVLTFAGRNRRNHRNRMQVGCVDDVIQSVLDQFRPSLENLGFEVVLDLDAVQPVEFDIDVTEQMLGNLISNAEKYGASGKHLRIRSRFQNDMTTIDVADAGPGVPPHFARHIFQPFERASDHIHSATGTGIGLTITRNLAQQHGGNLELLESTIGATFRLTLRTPKPTTDES